MSDEHDHPPDGEPAGPVPEEGQAGPSGAPRPNGYKNPPFDGRFRKDDGRKRPGRPPGHKNMRTGLREILTEPVPVTSKGRRRKVPAYLAHAQQTLAKAFKGDYRAEKRVDELAQRAGLFNDEVTGQMAAPLSSEQEEVLLDFMRRAGMEFHPASESGLRALPPDRPDAEGDR